MTDDEIRELARLAFVEKLRDYDYSDYEADLDSGNVRGEIVGRLGEKLVRYVIFTPASLDGGVHKDYGIVTIDPLTSECISVEVYNMLPK